MSMDLTPFPNQSRRFTVFSTTPEEVARNEDPKLEGIFEMVEEAEEFASAWRSLYPHQLFWVENLGPRTMP